MAVDRRHGAVDRRTAWRGGRRDGDHGNRPIVLVVDDHGDSRELIAAVLGAAEFATAEASNGVTALERILEAPPPCAVILDLGLPDCHGTDLIRILRQSAATAHLPILVVTASVTDADRRAAAAAGATVFLPKPILPDALLIALREALAAAP